MPGHPCKSRPQNTPPHPHRGLHVPKRWRYNTKPSREMEPLSCCYSRQRHMYSVELLCDLCPIRIYVMIRYPWVRAHKLNPLCRTDNLCNLGPRIEPQKPSIPWLRVSSPMSRRLQICPPHRDFRYTRRRSPQTKAYRLNHRATDIWGNEALLARCRSIGRQHTSCGPLL